MTLYRLLYDPKTVEEFAGLVNAMFDSTSHACHHEGENLDPNASKPFRPRMDVQESVDDNQVTAIVDLPGLRKADVVIEIDSSRLIISGEVNPSAQTPDKETFTVRERRTGKFSRSLQLPKGTKPEHITAKMDDGVLRLTFPKSHPELVQRVIIE